MYIPVVMRTQLLITTNSEGVLALLHLGSWIVLGKEVAQIVLALVGAGAIIASLETDCLF